LEEKTGAGSTGFVKVILYIGVKKAGAAGAYHRYPALRVLEMYGNSNVVSFYASWDNICY
ncbi:MAG: hypothetical protein J6M33_04840, partial [Anaerovibrio sp.]|nr:hypothetical protein [Anaerovibrio sp.]